MENPKHIPLPPQLQKIVIEPPQHASVQDEVVDATWVGDIVPDTFPEEWIKTDEIQDAVVVEDHIDDMPQMQNEDVPQTNFFNRVKNRFTEAKNGRPLRSAILGLGAAAIFAYADFRSNSEPIQSVNQNNSQPHAPKQNRRQDFSSLRSVRHHADPNAVLKSNTAILESMLEQSRKKRAKS